MMKKVLVLLAGMMVARAPLFSQDIRKDEAAKMQLEAEKLKGISADSIKSWKFGGVISLNGQQVSLTNWAAGGSNSIS